MTDKEFKEWTTMFKPQTREENLLILANNLADEINELDPNLKPDERLEAIEELKQQHKYTIEYYFKS